jgi:hypothetical protein
MCCWTIFSIESTSKEFANKKNQKPKTKQNQKKLKFNFRFDFKLGFKLRFVMHYWSIFGVDNSLAIIVKKTNKKNLSSILGPNPNSNIWVSLIAPRPKSTYNMGKKKKSSCTKAWKCL